MSMAIILSILDAGFFVLGSFGGKESFLDFFVGIVCGAELSVVIPGADFDTGVDTGAAAAAFVAVGASLVLGFFFRGLAAAAV